MVVYEPVQATIWQCLNHYDYVNAIFLAERLYAEVGSDDTLFLLATCYYRSGYPNRAHAILQSKGCPTPQCRFLMAKCSLELEKFSECEAALMGSSFPKNKSCEEVSSDFGDSAPFALQLLGKLCRKAERLNKATEAYKHCLKLNPFLWNSFQVLCDLGEKPDPESVFQLPPTSTLCTTSSQTDSCPIIDTENMTSHIITTPNQTPVNQVLGTPQENVFTMSGVRPLSVKTTPEMHFEVNITPDSNSGSFFPPPAPVSGRHTKTKPRPGRNIFGGGSSGSPLSPSFGILPLDTPSPGDAGSPTFISPQATDAQIPEPKAPRRAVRRGLPAGKPPKLPVFSQSGNNNSNTKESHSTALLPTSVPSPAQVLFTSAHHGVRRSSRLFSNANSVNASSVKENTSTKPTTRSKLGQTRATKGKTKTRGVKSSSITTSHESDLIIKSSESDEKLKSSVKAENYANLHAQILTFQKASAEGLLSLLRDLGSAYVSLTQFQCRKAIEKFSTIPPHHLNTGWIFSQLGRAHAELAEYQLAEKIFKRLRKLESHYLEGMEIYSTVLWHLHKEVELSALAQSLTSFDKNSPEVWCAVGNCFSVQKEHQTAINFFQRAIQVDPEFAYAYTLLGHEYVATEELEKAMKCFRNAIRINPRHYNGWYGIGMIYYRQEKFALAEVHYKKAIEINPQNAVLLVHLSVAQHALHKPDQSLALINRAMTLDRNNPLGRFQKASLLFATDKPQEALQELNELKQITPNESMIYFLMGKVYNKLGQTHLALASFSWAHDLDPKGSMSPVKEALDKHYLPDDDNSSQDLDEETYEADDGALGMSDISPTGSPRVSLDMQLQANESDGSL